MAVSLETARAFEAKGRLVAQSLSGKFAWAQRRSGSSASGRRGAVAWAVLAGHLSYWVSVPVDVDADLRHLRHPA